LPFDSVIGFIRRSIFEICFYIRNDCVDNHGESSHYRVCYR